VLDNLEIIEALHLIGQPTPLDRVRRVIVFLVNSLSSPKTNWYKSESPPGTVEILMKSAGVPIDRYSYEATELLKDMQAHWHSMRLVRESPAFAANQDEAVAAALRTPDVTLYAIDVSFSAVNKARVLATTVAMGIGRVLKSFGPECRLAGFGDSSADFVLLAWINDPQNGIINVKDAALSAV